MNTLKLLKLLPLYQVLGKLYLSLILSNLNSFSIVSPPALTWGMKAGSLKSGKQVEWSKQG